VLDVTLFASDLGQLLFMVMSDLEIDDFKVSADYIFEHLGAELSLEHIWTETEQLSPWRTQQSLFELSPAPTTNC
jgi:hypothetical protein